MLTVTYEILLSEKTSNHHFQEKGTEIVKKYVWKLL